MLDGETSFEPFVPSQRYREIQTAVIEALISATSIPQVVVKVKGTVSVENCLS